MSEEKSIPLPDEENSTCAQDIPRARTVGHGSATAASLRLFRRWLPLKKIGIVLGIVVFVGAAGSGITYCGWKNWFWLPDQARFAGDWGYVSESEPASTPEVRGTHACLLRHGGLGTLVAQDDDLGMVAVRYRNPEKLVIVDGKPVVVNVDYWSGDPATPARIRFKTLTESRSTPCEDGTVVLLNEEHWRDMPDYHLSVMNGIRSALAQKKSVRDLVKRVKGTE